MSPGRPDSAEPAASLDQPDHPSLVINYRTPEPAVDSWHMLLNAFMIAAAAFAVAQIIEEIAWAGRFAFIDVVAEMVLQAWRSPWSALMALGMLLSILAGITLLIGVVRCSRRAAWTRKMMIVGGALFIAGSISSGVGSALQDLNSPLRYRVRIQYAILNVLASCLVRIVFPALLIWFMTRPQVRRLFARSP